MLHFAEIYRTQPGRRVVNIELEGSTVRTNCDVVARVGLQGATTEIYQVLLTDGVKSCSCATGAAFYQEPNEPEVWPTSAPDAAFRVA